MEDYNFNSIATRILNERNNLYVSRGKSNQYNRDAEGRIIYAHKPMEGYKQATQKDVINIAKDLGFHIGRNSLSDIENGVKDASTITLGELSALSTIYGCEVGYLLCEQSEKHRSTIDIMDAVGLSSDAVQVLESFRKASDDDITLPMLSFCLADEDGDYLKMLMEQFDKFFYNALDDDKLVCLMNDADVLKIIQGILTMFREDYFKTHPKKDYVMVDGHRRFIDYDA